MYNCVCFRVPRYLSDPFLCAQRYGVVAFMSGGALLLDDTAIISATISATVRTDPWRGVQSHGALLRRVGDTGAKPLWSGPEKPAVVGVGAVR